MDDDREEMSPHIFRGKIKRLRKGESEKKLFGDSKWRLTAAQQEILEKVRDELKDSAKKKKPKLKTAKKKRLNGGGFLKDQTDAIAEAKGKSAFKGKETPCWFCGRYFPYEEIEKHRYGCSKKDKKKMPKKAEHFQGLLEKNTKRDRKRHQEREEQKNKKGGSSATNGVNDGLSEKEKRVLTQLAHVESLPQVTIDEMLFNRLQEARDLVDTLRSMGYVKVSQAGPEEGVRMTITKQGRKRIDDEDGD